MSVDVATLSDAVEAKHRALVELLRSYGRVVVAYSGGVDSAFLARVARDALGDRAIALTARSPSLMQVELEDAKALAVAIGIEHRVVTTHELDRPDYVKNETSRCYYCKTELFDTTQLAAETFEGAVVVDGFNTDDLADFRPGHRAAAEHDVRHPLAEVGLSKAEIRALSKQLGLPTWDKPQLACLSSRLPYGVAVTEERLARVERVEVCLRELGFFDVRARLVRDNDDMVRIEVGEAEIDGVVRHRSRIVAEAQAAGFGFVTLDLEGFRTGRLNEGLVQLGVRPKTN
ncbi:MAG: ATP-dependent sacrificial sulfur transferase LarE [Deltaproteobacteria bacterium]